MPHLHHLARVPALLTLLAGACAAAHAPEAAVPGLRVVTTHFADSTVATITCGTAAWRAAQRVTACDYAATKDGATIAVAPGFTTRVTLVGAEGAEAHYVVTATGYKPGLTAAQLAQRPGATVAFTLTLGVSLPTAPDTVIVTGGEVATGPAYPTVVVNTSSTYQTMEGFGTTVRLFDDPHFTETFDPITKRAAVVIPQGAQDAMVAAAYTDLRLTRVRYATEPGVEKVNDNADPYVVNPAGFYYGWKSLDGHAEYVAKARTLGVTTWWGSPGKAEAWMDAGDVPEYVEYAMQILRRWRDLGQPLPLWAIANEPGGAGNRSPEFHRQAIRALGPLLAAEGIPTRIVLADDDKPSNALRVAEAVLADPVARAYVAAVATHLYPYGGPQGLPEYESMAELSALAAAHNLPIWMTEWSNPDYLRWAITMHELVTLYNVSAIDYMWAAFGAWDHAQLMMVNYSGTTYTGFTKRPVYGALRQFSRYVAPGMVRVGTTAPSGVLATAYRGDGEIVVVLVNPAAAQTVRVACSACGALIGADRSTATEIGVAAAVGATVDLPAKSITTIRYTYDG